MVSHLLAYVILAILPGIKSDEITTQIQKFIRFDLDLGPIWKDKCENYNNAPCLVVEAVILGFLRVKYLETSS